MSPAKFSLAFFVVINVLFHSFIPFCYSFPCLPLSYYPLHIRLALTPLGLRQSFFLFDCLTGHDVRLSRIRWKVPVCGIQHHNTFAVNCTIFVRARVCFSNSTLSSFSFSCKQYFFFPPPSVCHNAPYTPYSGCTRTVCSMLCVQSLKTNEWQKQQRQNMTTTIGNE